MNETVISILRTAEFYGFNGHHEAAGALLAAIPEESRTTAVWILEAKLLAQQRRFPEAISRWKAALAAEPENRAALEGLKATEGMSRMPSVLARWRGTAAFLALTFAFALLVWVSVSTRADPIRPLLLEVKQRQLESAEQAAKGLADLAARIEKSESAAQAAQEANQKEIRQAQRQNARRIDQVGRDVARLREELTPKP